ncbi:histidine phosphatase family protein [Bradyrhizobium sp.]|uniref:SixA phosphatase family protein n=1 Tax=Bradyrhizobium sp. TaxID=376 RepID=UPI00271B0ADD|nr:histidine phosphatase family protein [Bradyrhizobium sp.]MDO9294856.1 histidine phosphatase family protein [Bradyrhizobium sp.]
MRRLLLLRHAKTENDAPSGRDQDRRLDKRGLVDAAEIGGWIGRHPPFPESVLVSPAVRANQTWDIAWEAMKGLMPPPQVEFVPDIYGADPAQLLEAVHAAVATDPKVLMLVGHNPGMHELALMLAGSGDAAGRKELGDNLPTSGLAIFDFEIDDWSDVAFRRGRLAKFVSPRLLRAEGC